jgi:hypothetical protein
MRRQSCGRSLRDEACRRHFGVASSYPREHVGGGPTSDRRSDLQLNQPSAACSARGEMQYTSARRVAVARHTGGKMKARPSEALRRYELRWRDPDRRFFSRNQP